MEDYYILQFDEFFFLPFAFNKAFPKTVPMAKLDNPIPLTPTTISKKFWPDKKVQIEYKSHP